MRVDQKGKLQALERAVESYQDWKLRNGDSDPTLADDVVVAAKELVQSFKSSEIGDQMEQVSAILKQFNAELRLMHGRIKTIEDELGISK